MKESRILMKIQFLAGLMAVTLGLLTTPAHAENLLQVYQQAKGYDARIQSRESGHLAVQEKRQQAQASFKPQIKLSANASHSLQYDTISDNTLDGNAADYAVKLGIPLYSKPLNAKLAQTDALVAQSAATLESDRQDLIIRTANAYFDALQAQDNVIVSQAERTAISHQLEQSKAYFEAGRSAITDVKEAEASHAAALAQEIAATQQLDIAREQLRVLTGGFYPLLDAPRANMPLTVPSPNNIEAWVQIAKQENHQLRAGKQAVWVAQKGIEVERAAKRPSVNLTASHTGSYLDNDNINNQQGYGSSVGISVDIPLYTGGSIASKIREAQFNAQQAQQQYDLQDRQTEQQVRSAFLSVQSSINQASANQQALDAAQTAVQATKAGFEVGTRTAVDVLNSLRGEFRARRDYAAARYGYLKNTLLLRQAAGTLTEKDVAALNAFLTPAPKG